MKNYEDPNMELFDINNGMKSGFDVNSNDDETEYVQDYMIPAYAFLDIVYEDGGSYADYGLGGNSL